MKRRGLACLFATLLASVVHADEPPRASYDLAGEIAWARAGWPGQLKGLHFHSPLTKLRSWAPRKGSVAAYLFTDDFACLRVELSRDEPEQGDAGDRPPGLSAKIAERAHLRDGHRVREFTVVSIGQELSREDGATHLEGLDARGRWQPEESGGIGVPPFVYGALSYADDRVVRFDGVPQVLHAYCGGPTEWLACPTGGERPCERCEEVSLLFSEKNSLWGHHRNYGKRPVTCRDRCPRYPESPNKRRVEELAGRTNLWRARQAPLAKVPSLYKSRDDCRREHRLDRARSAGGERAGQRVVGGEQIQAR